MSFTYARPRSLEEALDLFAQAREKAAYLAGGTDLLLKYRKKEAAPGLVISLNHIPGFDLVEEDDREVRVGAGATLRVLERSALIAARFPILTDALKHMASVQIRNAATMAGNVVNAAPSADTAPPLLALGAEVVLLGKEGERRMALKDFFAGPSRTVMTPGEILTRFIIRKPAGPAGGGYAKVSRRKAMDLALVGVAVQLELEDDLATCARARIALGVAGPTPIRSPEAEEVLKGAAVNPESLARAGNLAAQESSCRDSLRGEAWYRREMIRVYVRRMGLLALKRAREASTS